MNNDAAPLALISCSKKKLSGGDLEYHPSMKLQENLSPATYRKLMSLRRELALAFRYEPGLDLGFQEHTNNVRYMSAYLRYAGILYKEGSVTELYPQKRRFHLLIVSALYGIVDASDLIRDYDLHMKCKLPWGRQIKTWWKNNKLGNIVEEYISSVNPSKTDDLLFGDYRHALKPWPPTSLENQVLRPGTPEPRFAEIYRQGRILKALLLRCS